MKKLSTLSKSVIIALSIAGVGAGIGTAAVASGQLSTDKINIGKSDTSEAVAAYQSKISLEQAIAIAQQTAKGDLVSAEFDLDDDFGASATGEYEVKFVSGNNEIELKIDANTGKVIKAEQEQIDDEDIAEYTAMKQSKINLTQAMLIAKQKFNGKVIEAEFDLENNKPAYEIEITNGTQVQKIIIDASSGTIMTNQVDTPDHDEQNMKANKKVEQTQTASAKPVQRSVVTN